MQGLTGSGRSANFRHWRVAGGGLVAALALAIWLALDGLMHARSRRLRERGFDRQRKVAVKALSANDLLAALLDEDNRVVFAGQKNSKAAIVRARALDLKI